MENQTPEVILSPQKQKSNLVLWVVVGIAILAAGVGIGLMAGEYLFSNKTSETISSYQDCVKAPGSRTVKSYPGICTTADGQEFTQPVNTRGNFSDVQAETSDPTADWKTYLDPNSKFEFKYPNQYILDTADRSYLNRNITWSFENNSFSSCRGDCPVVSSSIKTTLGGQPATKISGYIGSVGGNVPQSYVAYEAVVGNKYFIFQIEALPIVMSREEYVQYNQSDIQPIKSEDLRVFDQIVSTFKFLETASGGCKSVNLGISLVLPNKDWSCKVDNLGKEQKGWDGTISLKTPIFSVQVSSLGRGAFCSPSDNDPQSPRYDSVNSCTTSTFYSKNNIRLETFKLNGQTKEIFGQINGGPSVSISYNNMETKELSEKDKSELFQVLDSISIEK